MTIKYNLRKDEHKNHPMDNKYGVIIINTPLAGYPVTIVDNHREVEYGKYTHIPTLCLLHLTEDVRYYLELRIFDEFLYLGFSFGAPTYKMYPYELKELSDTEVIRILKKVFYEAQPNLQCRSLVGSSSDLLKDDPNYYEGSYVLNDEQEYTILKCKDKYKFFRGMKHYYPHWGKEEELIYEGDIDFELYELAIEVCKLRASIVTETNKLLDDESNNSIERYYSLKSKLKEALKSQISD
jgi:hypothetical protein